MDRIYLKHIRIILIILLVHSLVSYLNHTVPGVEGFCPFRGYYRFGGNCVAVGEKFVEENISISENNTFFFFTSRYSNLFTCVNYHYKEFEEHEFNVNTDAGTLKFEVLEDKIIVNGKTLNKNETYSKTNYFIIRTDGEFNLNFWATAKLDLKYYGSLPFCPDEHSDMHRNVVNTNLKIGKSLGRGTVLTLLIIILIILTTMKIRSMNKTKKKKISKRKKIIHIAITIILKIIIVGLILMVLYHIMLHLLLLLAILLQAIFPRVY